jgi:hypothetical protein
VDEVSHSPTGCWLVTLKDDSGIIIIVIVISDELLAILCGCVFFDERSPLCITSYKIFVEFLNCFDAQKKTLISFSKLMNRI